MRKGLRNLVRWLDARFPERVVVTQVSYEGLLNKLKGMETIMDALIISQAELKTESDERMKKLDDKLRRFDAEINKLNVSQGFTAGMRPPAFQR